MQADQTTRWAFLNPETGDWIEVKPGTVAPVSVVEPDLIRTLDDAAQLGVVGARMWRDLLKAGARRVVIGPAVVDWQAVYAGEIPAPGEARPLEVDRLTAVLRTLDQRIAEAAEGQDVDNLIGPDAEIGRRDYAVQIVAAYTGARPDPHPLQVGLEALIADETLAPWIYGEISDEYGVSLTVLRDLIEGRMPDPPARCARCGQRGYRQDDGAHRCELKA